MVNEGLGRCAWSARLTWVRVVLRWRVTLIGVNFISHFSFLHWCHRRDAMCLGDDWGVNLDGGRGGSWSLGGGAV